MARNTDREKTKVRESGKTKKVYVRERERD